MILPVPVKLPDSFEKALGYTHGRRWVAFFWEPCGDESMYSDGLYSGCGNWHGFLEFTRHAAVRPWLQNYNLGSSENDADHWLLCDLEERDLFVGERGEVADQLVRATVGDIPAPQVVRLNWEEVKDLLDRLYKQLTEVQAPSVEEIENKMRDDRQAVEAMVSELESNHDYGR